MVLHLKVWKSKSLPGLLTSYLQDDAGWSSPVARQAHNLKVAGSNPAPATNIKNKSLPIRKHQPSLGENSKEILEEIGYNNKEITKIIDLNKK